MNHPGTGLRVVILALFVGWPAQLMAQQPKPMSKLEHDEVVQMLHSISDDVKKHYYDKTLRNINWNDNVKSFEARIDNAPSLNRGLSEVAAALDVLDDSHTFFLPPARPTSIATT